MSEAPDYLQPPDAKRQSRVNWPTPHITVSYRQTEYAFGRQMVAKMGYALLKRELFSILPLGSSGQSSNPFDAYDKSLFKTKAVLLGIFRTVYGENNARPVVLTPVGWEIMVEDLISIKLVYEEGLPGK